MSRIGHNGGPAFPFDEKHDDGSHYRGWEGMTLRDWFATHASSGDIERYQHYEVSEDELRSVPRYSREQARYRFADAMLEARGVAS